MPVAVNGLKCFSYWAQLIGNDTSIQISAVKFGNSVTAENQIQTLSLSNGTRTTWTKFSVDINPLVLNATEFAIRIRGKFNNPISFIALDDIKLTDGVCDSSTQSQFICNNGIQIDMSKVCNFVNDCGQNEDELNCGACDFETGNSFFEPLQLISY